MNSFFLQADSVLRSGTRQASNEQADRAAERDAATQDSIPDDAVTRGVMLLGCILLFGAFYGAVMGTFGGVRPQQVLFSAIKVPLLLVVTGGLSVPSFFVLYSLWGLRGDFGPVLRALLSTQAALAVVLASLAPFTLLFYLSSSHYEGALLFNGAMFGVASASAQLLLRRLCRPLMQRDPRHRKLLWGWLVVYAFIGIQLGWVLRPFVGSPNNPTAFFRADSLSNAYEALLHTVWRVL